MKISNITKGHCKECMAGAWRNFKMSLFVELLDSVTQCFFVSVEKFQDSLNVGPVLFSCSAFTWTQNKVGQNIIYVANFHIVMTLFFLLSFVHFHVSRQILSMIFSFALFNQQSYLLICSCQPLHFSVLECPFESNIDSITPVRFVMFSLFSQTYELKLFSCPCRKIPISG